MTSILIENVQLILPAGIRHGACFVQDGVIADLFEEPFLNMIIADESTIQIDGEGQYLAPGLIDLQLNGGFGHDFTHDPESIWDVAADLPQLGVTSFLPTIITSPLARSREARNVLRARPAGFVGAQPLGLHLEGPFLNPAKKGAHNPSYILSPEDCPADALNEWSAEDGVRLVTLAPEMPGALHLIKQLVEQGIIVSAGHSMATLEEARAGFEAGIRYVTHLFNAMPPLHHREPGLVAAALAHSEVAIGLIPDGVHVHPDLIRLVWQLAPDRINGVTDAMAAMGMSPGEYALGDYVVTVSDVDARLPSGTLAGSIVLPMDVVRNLAAFTGCGLAAAVRSMTRFPADLLQLGHQIGVIAIGHDADLILFDGSYQIQKTIVKGSIVYDTE